jgi:hypothetical protein
MRQLLNSITAVLFLMSFSAARLAGRDLKKCEGSTRGIAVFKATDPDLELFFNY